MMDYFTTSTPSPPAKQPRQHESSSASYSAAMPRDGVRGSPLSTSVHSNRATSTSTSPPSYFTPSSPSAAFTINRQPRRTPTVTHPSHARRPSAGQDSKLNLSSSSTPSSAAATDCSSTSPPSLEQQAQISNHQLPFPTANPFKLSNAHPTAFPVQNGASLGFQQALLARQNSSSGTGTGTGTGSQTAAPTLSRLGSTSMDSCPTTTTSVPQTSIPSNVDPFDAPPSSSTRLLHKRHQAPSLSSTTPKSVRTPIITSPRKTEAVSPQSSRASSSSPASAAMRSPAATSSTSTISVADTQPQSINHPQMTQFAGRTMPKLNLAPATPGIPNPNHPSSSQSQSQSQYQPVSPKPSLAFPGQLSLRQAPARAFGTSAVAGASTTATGMRRGSAIINPRFIPVLPHDSTTNPKALALSRVLQDSAQGTTTALVIDLRPHTAFVTQGRIANSINVCVPSTLLRRPNFGLSKIAETLCTKKDRKAFNSAFGLSTSPSLSPSSSPEHDCIRILVLDQESSYLSADSAINSLLSKLERYGFKGDLCWLQGGFNSILRVTEEVQQKDREAPQPALLQWLELNTLNETDEEEDDSETEDDDTSVDEPMRMQESPETINDPRASLTNPNATSAMPANTSAPHRSSSSSVSSGSDSLFPSSLGSSSVSSVGESTSPSNALSTDANGSFKNGFPATDKYKAAFPPSKSSSNPLPRLNLRGATHDLKATGNPPSRSTGSTPVIRPRNLPLSAFTFGSTAAFSNANEDKGPSKDASSGNPASSAPLAGAAWRSQADHLVKSGRISSHGQSQHRSGKAEHHGHPHHFQPGSGSAKPVSRAAANPFFDNIRQNIETASLESTLAHVAPLEIPEEFTRPEVVSRLPPFLKTFVALTPRTRAEKVHREFFEIEQNEQKRLQKVLDWHCAQSQTITTAPKSGQEVVEEQKQNGDKHDNTYHPFSISAGVEKGHLNRYKNMWPYEHARVRLAGCDPTTCGDYINASYIRLRGTNKCYIASQGPLEGTTEHFWKLVLQENVRVIVMLTLLSEGGREKCFNYFKTGTYGPISVTLKEERGDLEAVRQSQSEDRGFFTLGETVSASPSSFMTQPTEDNSDTPKQGRSKRLDSSIVKRVLEIRNNEDPSGTPPFTVTHIQYIRWPDFDIPPDPHCVVDLITETTKAQALSRSESAPVLVHCSAGVGRTGTFIAVDILLERFRMQFLNAAEDKEKMEVDEEDAPSLPLASGRQNRSNSNVSNSNTMQAMRLDGDGGVSPAPNHTAGSTPHLPHSRTASTDSPTSLLAKLEQKDLLPQDYRDPVMALVDQMREQRMSSVANAGQYVFTYLALLAGIQQDSHKESPTAREITATT